MDRDTCFCGKRVLYNSDGSVKNHRPKRNFQPRFFIMSRKDRKVMWCDVEMRLAAVQQTVRLVPPQLEQHKQHLERMAEVTKLENLYS